MMVLALGVSGYAQDSPSSVTNQFLSSLSGTPDKQRDWEKLSAMMSPNCRMTVVKGESGNSFTGAEFLKMVKENSAKAPFTEQAIEEKTVVFGHIAHVFQSYEKWSDPKKKGYGINIYTLVQTENGWVIHDVIWEDVASREELTTHWNKMLAEW